jgi:hypothetical protein
MTRILNSFGGEAVPIVIARSAKWKAAEAQPSELLLVLTGSDDLNEAAADCARKISDHLASYEQRYTKLSLGQLAQQEAKNRQEGQTVQSKEDRKESRARAISVPPAEHDIVPMAAPMYAPMAPSQSRRPIHDALASPSADAAGFFDILVSFRAVIPRDKFELLEDELRAFSEEYNHGHYTSCGLRIGRTIEHIVYALALAWHVQVNRTTLHVLSDLQNSFEQLSATLITYASAPEPERPKVRKNVQDHCSMVSRKLFDLAFRMDAGMEVVATNVPINVEAILRDIKKQFSAHPNVRRSIDAIESGKIVRGILDFRNNAAHADTGGVRRELSEEDVQKGIELLRTALFLLSNVAFAVADRTRIEGG